MAEFDVSSGVIPLNFGATGTEEILQNVRTILNTMAYTVPMIRGFAWSPNIDAPMNVATTRITAQIVTAIQDNEPRAQVMGVRFEGNGLNGQLKPIVRIRIEEGGAT